MSVSLGKFEGHNLPSIVRSPDPPHMQCEDSSLPYPGIITFSLVQFSTSPLGSGPNKGKCFSTSYGDRFGSSLWIISSTSRLTHNQITIFLSFLLVLICSLYTFQWSFTKKRREKKSSRENYFASPTSSQAWDLIALHGCENRPYFNAQKMLKSIQGKV